MKDTFRRYVAAFNAGDLAAFGDLVTDDYLNNDPSLPDLPRGPEGLARVVADMRSQAPDLRFEEVQLIEEGDTLAAHLLVHGVADTPVRQIQVERFRDGRICEHWRATGAG